MHIYIYMWLETYIYVYTYIYIYIECYIGQYRNAATYRDTLDHVGLVVL